MRGDIKPNGEAKKKTKSEQRRICVGNNGGDKSHLIRYGRGGARSAIHKLGDDEGDE
jgi:hypothetical protein